MLFRSAAAVKDQVPADDDPVLVAPVPGDLVPAAEPPRSDDGLAMERDAHSLLAASGSVSGLGESEDSSEDLVPPLSSCGPVVLPNDTGKVSKQSTSSTPYFFFQSGSRWKARMQS